MSTVNKKPMNVKKTVQPVQPIQPVQPNSAKKPLKIKPSGHEQLVKPANVRQMKKAQNTTVQDDQKEEVVQQEEKTEIEKREELKKKRPLKVEKKKSRSDTKQESEQDVDKVIDDRLFKPSLTGVKRALLIGINYLNDPYNKLNGCINDVQNIKQLLITKFGYKAENIILLSDNQTGELYPSKQNIINHINKIVALLKSGDTLFLHYSGHGTQIRAKDGNENLNTDTRGEDDCICPCDFDNYNGPDGFVTDNVLKELLVNKIPKGAKLRAFFDCCHSGSILDLEYMWKKNEEYYKQYSDERLSDDIITISGCRDSQTSADSWNAQKKEAAGALTMMLIKALTNTPTINTTWKDLVLLVRHYLADTGYSQLPLLSVSNKTLGVRQVDL